MTGYFKGKVAIVTGSGQSIGRAIARLLAREDAAVITNSRTEISRDGTPTAADTAAEIAAQGGRAFPIFADVGTMEGAQSLVDAAVREFGGLDLLINNAGYASTLALQDMSEAQWDAEIATNLKAAFATTFYAAPRMKARGGGRILNVISRVGLIGLPTMAAYSAAKAGVVGLTFAFAKELESQGISVNCLAPTANTVRAQRTAAERYAKIGQTIPSSDKRTPEHVAPFAAYLVSEAAAGITGQIFYAAAGEITLYAPHEARRSIFKDGSWTLDELTATVPSAFGSTLKPPAVRPPPV